jgi:hypothetical protein
MGWSDRLMRERNREIAPLDAEHLTPQLVAWLDELLVDCAASPRPSAWERNFLENLAERYRQFRERTRITEAQMKVLRHIEEKIHACG